MAWGYMPRLCVYVVRINYSTIHTNINEVQHGNVTYIYN